MKYFCLSVLCLAFALSANAAGDPSIDKLIAKLPPADKFVDPAGNDPLAKQFVVAIKEHNYGTAMQRSRQLAAKYPKSLGAQLANAEMAVAMKNYGEANAAFHKVLALRPDFALAYFGLGISEAGQQHFRAALGHFQQVTRLEPSRDWGWIACSACAEKLGQKQVSLDYARHGTTAAPKSPGVWFQAAREESLAGNKKAAADDLRHANQLRQTQPKQAAHRR